MIAKSVVIATMLLFSSFGLAAPAAIGTASARGEMRVDGYTVRDSATVFNGSTVETGDAGAVVRLARNTEIKLAADSRGTLFRDHLLLSRGETELTASHPFRLEVNGLDVLLSSPNTNAVVSVNKANTVEVAALAGALRVTNSGGALLARVTPGATASLSSAPAGTAPSTSAFSDVGKVTYVNGHYYLTSSATGARYEIVGKDLQQYVGKKVAIHGTVQAGTAQNPVAVAINSVALSGGAAAGMPVLGKVLLGTGIAGGGAVVGYVVSSAASP